MKICIRLLWLAVLVTLFSALGTLAVNGEVYRGDCGENDAKLTWELETETGVLNIRGEGSMKSYAMAGVPWYSLRNEIRVVTFGEGVRSIGNWAFHACKNLKAVEFPSSMTDIGYYAFGYCEGLEEVELPSSLVYLERGAFYECMSLKRVDIPLSVKDVGEYAFSGCDALSEIVFLSAVTRIYDSKTVIPDTATIYGDVGSTAAVYAEKHGKAFVGYGDANGDGAVNGQDLLLLRKYLANYDYAADISHIEIEAGADANGDGYTDGRDLLLLRKYLANFDYTGGTSTVVLGKTA